MTTGVQISPLVPGNGQRSTRTNGERGGRGTAAGRREQREARSGTERKARVYVAAENRLLREALSRMLMRQGDIEVAGTNSAGPFHTEALVETECDVLLMTSRGKIAEDLLLIRGVRTKAPEVQILLIGVAENEPAFLHYVSAGIKGYLPKDATAGDVIESVRAVQGGEVVCPGSLCALLFRYLESETGSLPSAALHQRLGLTRREQQLIPLIAQGLTNKEIANHFCLSEQTVKNHLYRMKHKVGAGDRLSIVQHCRTQGFLV